jgi:anti-anti-sigma factor
MDLTVEARDDGTSVVRPAGRLDLLAAPGMRQRLAAEVAAGRRLIVVDLGSVSFIDSSGLGSLIGGLRAARQAGSDLRIAGASEQARMIFELMALDQVLHPYATVEDAIAGS